MSGYAIEFMTALKNGHLQGVQELLDTGVDVETTDDNGDSGLIVAILGGDLQLIDLLCRNEADVNLSKPGGDKPLMVAVAEGRRDVVDLLCQKLADVNATNEKGVSPLMSIRSDDHWDIAKLLIETYKADVNQKSARGASVLMSAAEKGMKSVVAVLVKNGADVDYATKSGWSALLKATQGGHLDTVNLLLRKKANVDQKTKDNWTALNLACYKSYSSIAETLIMHRADVNNVTSKGFSPLMCACNNRDLRIIKLLMDHGADKNKIASDGMTALELAHSTEDEEVEYLLTFDGDDNEMLMQAARDVGKVNIFKTLLDFGIDANTTSKNKTSVLMLACKAGNQEAVQLLLSRDDVMIDAVNKHGWNALMMASHGGHLGIVSQLLKKRAEVNAVNKRNDSALIMAAYKGHTEVVELLLQFKADVNHANQQKWTAAMLASQNNHVRMLQILLQHGAAVDMVNNEGYSPLMIASEYGFINIVECLCGINGGENISVDASVLNSKNVHVTPNSQNYINISNDNGESALMLACRHGHEEIVDLLVNRGAKLNHRDNDGLDPLLTAATSGHLAAVKILLQHQADVDSEDDSGDTALTIAARRNDLNLARLLLEHNANMNHQNKINLTPLVIAWELDHEELLGVLKLYKTKQRKENRSPVDDLTDPGAGGSFHSLSTDDVNSDLGKKQLQPVGNISHPSELPGSYPNLTDEATYTIAQRLSSDPERIFATSNSETSPRSFSTVIGSCQLTEPVSSTLHNKDNQLGDGNLVKLMGGHELVDATVHSQCLGDTLGTLSATGPGLTNARHQNTFTHKTGDLVLERNQQFKVKSHYDAETKNSSNHNDEDQNMDNVQDDNLVMFTEMDAKDTFSIKQEVNDNVSTKQNQTDIVSLKQNVKHFVSIKACEKDAFSIKLDGKDIVSTKHDVNDTLSLNRDITETVSLNRDTNETVSLNRDTNETVSLNRDTNETVSLNRDTNETMSLNRDTSETVSLNRDTNETVSLNRDTIETVSLNRYTSETVSLNRDTNETVSLHRDTNETVSLNRDTSETVSLNRDTNENVSLKLNYKDITSINQDHKIGVSIKQDSLFTSQSNGSIDSTSKNSSIGLVIEPTSAEDNTCAGTNLHFEEICNKDSAQVQTVKTKPQINIKKDGFLFQTSLNAQESMSDHQHLQAPVSLLRSFPMTHTKDEQGIQNPVFSVHSSRENSRSTPKDRFDEPELKRNDKEENHPELNWSTARNGPKEDLENNVAKSSIKNNEVFTSSNLGSAAVDLRENTSLKLCLDESQDPLRSDNGLETHREEDAEMRLVYDFYTMSEHHSELELLNSSELLGTSNHQIAETKALSTGGKSNCSYVPTSPINTREDFVSVHKKETGNPTGKRTQPLPSIKSNITIGSVDYLTTGESLVESLQHSKLAHIQGRGNDVTRVDPLPLGGYLMDNKVFFPENTIIGDTGNGQSTPTPMGTSALAMTETPITSQKQDEPIQKWFADIISAVSGSSSVNAAKPETPLHLNIHYDATVHNVTIPSTQYCAINNSSITATNEPPAAAAASKIGSETKRDVTSVRGRKEPLPPEEAALILKHYHYLKNELDATAVVEHLCAEGIFDADDKCDVLAPSSWNRKSHVLLQKLLNAGTGDAFDVFVEIVEKVQPGVSDRLKVASGVAGLRRSKKNCCLQ